MTLSSVWRSGLFELGAGAAQWQGGQADIVADAAQAGPDWEDLFAADRSLRDDHPSPSGNGIPDYSDVHGGQWAVIMSDDVSYRPGVDTTALAADGRVYRGIVPGGHDLSNAYVYSVLDANGSLFLFAAAERARGGDTEIEFEFNQTHIRLGHGPPWVITGGRAAGDVLVRVRFVGGTIQSATVHEWRQTTNASHAFEQVAVVVGEGCNAAESLCATTNAVTINSGTWGSLDFYLGPESIGAGRFVEIGMNVTGLLGSVPAFTSIQVRTPQDITFGYFAEGN